VIMRNIFKTGCFGNRGSKAITRGMGRNGVKKYSRETKNNTTIAKKSPDTLPAPKAMGALGLFLVLLSVFASGSDACLFLAGIGFGLIIFAILNAIYIRQCSRSKR